MTKQFTVSTLGCKLNFSESSAFVRELTAHGYTENKEGKDVGLIIVNTCAVTQQAEKKCRQTIKQLIKKSPKAKVVVTGCFSQLSAERIAEIEGVDMILGNEEKISLVHFIETNKPSETIVKVSKYEKISSFQPSYSSEGRTRCFLKIQDGCDYFCTYCTIPLARGKSRSTSITKTTNIAKEALDTGAKELILTGVNIGTFGKLHKESFLNLLMALDALDGDFRIRLGSVEPELLKDEIIDFVAQSKHIVPHFHLPLQSGSNDVLRLMKRRYTKELFAQRIKKIKDTLPHAFIGIDVIVGMNGETAEMYQEAYAFLKDLHFSQLHVFTYSERPNTKAIAFTPKVSPQEKKDRSQSLLELSGQKHLAFANAHIGHQSKVLFEEGKDPSKMYGYTENYIRIQAPLNSKEINHISSFTITTESLVL